jgi:VHS domain
LTGPKNDPPTVVQEKVLSLIQSWADAFRHQAEMAGVVAVYSELRQKGIEFPMTDLDTMAPIITPQRVSCCTALLGISYYLII